MTEPLHENPLAFFQNFKTYHSAREILFNTLCAFREINTPADVNDAFFFSLSDDLAQIQALEQIFYMHIHKIFMDYNEDLL